MVHNSAAYFAHHIIRIFGRSRDDCTNVTIDIDTTKKKASEKDLTNSVDQHHFRLNYALANLQARPASRNTGLISDTGKYKSCRTSDYPMQLIVHHANLYLHRFTRWLLMLWNSHSIAVDGIAKCWSYPSQHGEYLWSCSRTYYASTGAEICSAVVIALTYCPTFVS
eukprot:scaffold301598_cov20-Prasinocladus_malaysianus.AAC.2